MREMVSLAPKFKLFICPRLIDSSTPLKIPISRVTVPRTYHESSHGCRFVARQLVHREWKGCHRGHWPWNGCHKFHGCGEAVTRFMRMEKLLQDSKGVCHKVHRCRKAVTRIMWGGRKAVTRFTAVRRLLQCSQEESARRFIGIRRLSPGSEDIKTVTRFTCNGLAVTRFTWVRRLLQGTQEESVKRFTGIGKLSQTSQI